MFGSPLSTLEGSSPSPFRPSSWNRNVPLLLDFQTYFWHCLLISYIHIFYVYWAGILSCGIFSCNLERWQYSPLFWWFIGTDWYFWYLFLSCVEVTLLLRASPSPFGLLMSLDYVIWLFRYWLLLTHNCFVPWYFENRLVFFLILCWGDNITLPSSSGHPSPPLWSLSEKQWPPLLISLS